MRMIFRENSLKVIVVVLNRINLMKIYTIKLCAALFFIIFVPKVIAGDGVYTYRDPVFPDKRLSLNLRDNVFQIADVGMIMSSCGPEDEYACIVSDVFLFTFQKMEFPSRKSGKSETSNTEMKKSRPYPSGENPCPSTGFMGNGGK